MRGIIIIAMEAVAIAGYFLGEGLTLYIHIFPGARMSLFNYSLAFLCKEHLHLGGGG